MRDGGPVVQLDVDIEDGQIQETVVDTIPTVRRSVVSTQAIVGEGQTLVIGGYRSTQRTNQIDKVPGLGSVPVVGMLFSNKVNNTQSRERLFMIRPRVVSLPPNMSQAVSALQMQESSAIAQDGSAQPVPVVTPAPRVHAQPDFDNPVMQPQ